MMLAIFSIYDRKAEVYFPPQCYHNEETAKRSLRMEFEKNPLTPMVMFPDDYDLYCVGAWDDATAEIRVVGPPSRRCCGVRELVTSAVE